MLRGVPLLEMLRSAVSLAVAAVPGGPARGGDDHAGARHASGCCDAGTLVRRLAAVESLGAITVICVDKTGTLTENRMTVDSLVGRRARVRHGTSRRGGAATDPALARALRIAVLCNEAELDDAGGAGARQLDGERAARGGARRRARLSRATRQRYPVRAVAPPPRRRPLDGHDARGRPDGDPVLVKGAPEQVLARVDAWIHGGRPQPSDAEKRGDRGGERRSGRAGPARARAGLQDPSTAMEEPTYEGLVLAGLVALTDPIRPGVPEAIRACRRAGHPDRW